MKRLVLVLALVAVALVPLAGQVQFSGLDLNQASELLFTATTDVPRFGEYETLFVADIPAETMTQYTFFPERIALLGESGQIQVQNRYGVFRTPSDGTTTPGFEPVGAFPAFVNGMEIQTGKTYTIGASPDGRFLSYLRPTSAGYGELVLYDTTNAATTTVSRSVELSIETAPLKWSGDSTFFVYARANDLYYFSIEQYDDGRILSERLRRIGPGQITSVTWDDEDTLYYLSGTLVYRVLGIEFFTRSLYQDLLKIGTIVGKLPSAFDPNFDRFWMAPDGRTLLLSRDGRNITLHYLQLDDYAFTGEPVALPYLFLPRNTRVRSVLWSEDDILTIFTGSIIAGETQTGVYRLAIASGETSAFQATGDTDVLGMALSPDGRRAATWTASGVQIRDYATWTAETEIDRAGVLHTLWANNDSLVVAGSDRIDEVAIGSSRVATRLMALSQVDAYGFDAATGAVTVQVGESVLAFGESGWERAASFAVADPGVASEDYRVYLESIASGSYVNMVMVRNVDSFGTQPLFARPSRTFEPFPDRDEAVDFTNFSHGSRIRQRELSLVFNAIDSVSGLTEVLNTLREFDVTATFFVNGDFIRRHPGAVREIAESGHEVGNLFFTHFDFAGGAFQITGDFVQQGLARNEDEYFDATGRELSLLWHAPYYFVSPELLAASSAMNYTYVGRDVDSLDWVPKRDDSGVSRLYRPSAQIVDEVIEAKKPGSIIAMTIGRPGDDRPDGGRDDYLFQRLDVLINGLIERGYEIVPVSTLIDNAR